MAEKEGGGSFRKFIGGIQDKLTGSSTFYPITQQCEDITKEGWLRKQGGAFRSWHRRWFKLQNDYLHYFTDQNESKHQGSVWLPGNNVVEHSMNPAKPDEFLFEIIPAGDKTRVAQHQETYLLCSSTEAERRAWTKLLRRVMFAHKGGGRFDNEDLRKIKEYGNVKGNGDGDIAIFGGSISSTLQHEIRLRGPRKIPEIVEMCANFIIENGLETEGIFRLPGRASLIRELKEKFDTGERPPLTSDNHDVPTVASLLKQYLRDLPEPLVPLGFYERVMKVVNREMPLDPDAGTVLLQELMSEIPHHSYNLLQYLCQLLSRIADNHEENKMTPMNLATVFVHSVIRPEDDDPALLMGTANSRTQCTFFFIVKHESIFSRDYPLGESTAVADLVGDLESDQHGQQGSPQGQSSVQGQSSTPGDGDAITNDVFIAASEENGVHSSSSPEIDGSNNHVTNSNHHVTKTTTNLDSVTADDLLGGFNPNHFSPLTDTALPSPLTPKTVETENNLNRRGSRKGRVFNPDLNYGGGGGDGAGEESGKGDDDFAHAEYVDSELIHRSVPISPERQNSDFYPGYESIDNLARHQHQQHISPTDPNQTQSQHNEPTDHGDYSHLTNYSSNPPHRIKERLDSDDYSYLPPDYSKPVLRKKPSLDSSLQDKPHRMSHRQAPPRPASSPPRPPPKPRPRTSITKSRESSVEPETDSNSLYSLPFDSISESGRQAEMREAASELLAIDIATQLASRDDCVAHIEQLRRVLADQTRQLSVLATDAARDKARYESALCAKDEQIGDLEARLERAVEEKEKAIADERRATHDAVERVMTLQGELQKYITRHGSLVAED